MIAWAALLAAVAMAALAWAQRRRVASLRRQLERTTADLERVQQSCALLAPAGIVERVVSEGIEVAAERKIVTAMFVDLVGYTSLSERLEPAVMARLLNGYFERTSDAVTAHRGRVSTFLGDGVLALFGALEPNPWQASDSVAAALALREAMARYSDELEREGLPRLTVGIGIHRGAGLAGLMGSRERREYTVVGRTVNLAARVQALTRAHGVDLLITEAVREQLDPRVALRAMPPVAVKGVEEPVVTYAVVDEVTAKA